MKRHSALFGSEQDSKEIRSVPLHQSSRISDFLSPERDDSQTDSVSMRMRRLSRESVDSQFSSTSFQSRDSINLEAVDELGSLVEELNAAASSPSQPSLLVEEVKNLLVSISEGTGAEVQICKENIAFMRESYCQTPEDTPVEVDYLRLPETFTANNPRDSNTPALLLRRESVRSGVKVKLKNAEELCVELEKICDSIPSATTYGSNSELELRTVQYSVLCLQQMLSGSKNVPNDIISLMSTLLYSISKFSRVIQCYRDLQDEEEDKNVDLVQNDEDEENSSFDVEQLHLNSFVEPTSDDEVEDDCQQQRSLMLPTKKKHLHHRSNSPNYSDSERDKSFRRTSSPNNLLRALHHNLAMHRCLLCEELVSPLIFESHSKCCRNVQQANQRLYTLLDSIAFFLKLHRDSISTQEVRIFHELEASCLEAIDLVTQEVPHHPGPESYRNMKHQIDAVLFKSILDKCKRVKLRNLRQLQAMNRRGSKSSDPDPGSHMRPIPIPEWSMTSSQSSDGVDEVSTLASDRIEIAVEKTTKEHPLWSIQGYDVETCLTRGAYGRVYIAVKRQTNQRVALKVMNKRHMQEMKQVDRIQREKDVLFQLNHPLIIKFFSSFQTAMNVYLTMELASGGDLSSYLDERAPLDESSTKIIAMELFVAIEYLHSKNIVHRDLKPDNCLISAEGHLKVADFGLSYVGTSGKQMFARELTQEILRNRELAQTMGSPPLNHQQVMGSSPMEPVSLSGIPIRASDSDPRLQSSHELSISASYQSLNLLVSPSLRPADRPSFIPQQIPSAFSCVGTPQYVAPEILMGVGHDRMVDIWAIGVILYECIHGTTPFEGDSPAEVFKEVLSADIFYDSNISKDLQSLLHLLLKRNPRKRLGARSFKDIQRQSFFQNSSWKLKDMLCEPSLLRSNVRECDTSAGYLPQQRYREVASDVISSDILPLDSSFVEAIERESTDFVRRPSLEDFPDYCINHCDRCILGCPQKWLKWHNVNVPVLSASSRVPSGSMYLPKTNSNRPNSPAGQSEIIGRNDSIDSPPETTPTTRRRTISVDELHQAESGTVPQL